MRPEDAAVALYIALGFISGLVVTFYWAECMPKKNGGEQ